MDSKKLNLELDHRSRKFVSKNISNNGLEFLEDNSVLFEHLSLEIIVKIMSSLTLADILLLERTSKKFSNATSILLRTRKIVDFTEIGERRVGKECRSRWSPYH